MKLEASTGSATLRLGRRAAGAILTQPQRAGPVPGRGREGSWHEYDTYARHRPRAPPSRNHHLVSSCSLSFFPLLGFLPFPSGLGLGDLHDWLSVLNGQILGSTCLRRGYLIRSKASTPSERFARSILQVAVTF